jgi:hypothetical protein
MRVKSLNTPFWHQKVRSNPFFAHILNNIMHKNNNLSGADPAMVTILTFHCST